MTWDTDNYILNNAKKQAIIFCKNNGLSIEKLKTQSFFVFGETAAFMQKADYHGMGLLEDLESQPKPTLEYDVKSKKIRPSKYVDYLRD